MAGEEKCRSVEFNEVRANEMDEEKLQSQTTRVQIGNGDIIIADTMIQQARSQRSESGGVLK